MTKRFETLNFGKDRGATLENLNFYEFDQIEDCYGGYVSFKVFTLVYDIFRMLNIVFLYIFAYVYLRVQMGSFKSSQPAY